MALLYRTSVQMLVPFQYVCGGYPSATSENAWDGDANTTLLGSVSANWYPHAATSQYVRWLYIYGHNKPLTSGHHSTIWDNTVTGNTDIYCEGDNTGAGYFALSSGSFHSQITRSSGAGVEANCLVKNSGHSVTGGSGYPFGVFGSSIVPSDVAYRGLIFSEDFALPVYDRNYSIDESFGEVPSGSRTNTGALFPNVLLAKSNQLKLLWSLSWSGLTKAQWTIFESFLAAFGGNIHQPFVMAVMGTNSGGYAAFESHWFCITDKTIEPTLNRTGEYNIKFSAYEILPNY